ncbi:MAG: exodeoxyribonuclease VII small subunit [Synechococcaceae cyanobacterium]|nr:exodeoxyribonuclease VII small subunit [Synechococcaceae cyanobacterium]
MAPKSGRPSDVQQPRNDGSPIPAPGGEATAGGTRAEQTLPADLSFRQAQAALELILSQLQSDDLDIEVMVDLHRRAEAYADHCEQLLRQVEQEVMLWNPEQPDTDPAPYTP